MVYYQDHCFWIDNNDLRSKLDFIFLMVFASLTESRSIPQIPMVTISAGAGGDKAAGRLRGCALCAVP